MTEEHYAILNIYSGLCSDMVGIGEGEFGKKHTTSWATEYEKQRYTQALNCLKKGLSEGYWNWAIDYCYDYDFGGKNLVKDEGETKKLISFIEREIPKSEAWIIPLNCAHGKIQFRRQMKFPGFFEGQRKTLLTKLKSSGYLPDSEKCWENSLKFF